MPHATKTLQKRGGGGHVWSCLKTNVDLERKTEGILSLLALKAYNTYWLTL